MIVSVCIIIQRNRTTKELLESIQRFKMAQDFEYSRSSMPIKNVTGMQRS